MKFNLHNGCVEFNSDFFLQPGMNRQDILTMTEWEDWTIIDGIPAAYRKIIDIPHKDISSKTILIVHIGVADGPLAFWDIAPWEITDGTQCKPEGKYTRRMRNWFFDISNVRLPYAAKWGSIDASYDPWNQSTGVFCNYRE